MPNDRDEELKREIDTHLELEAEERIEEGLSADQAWAAARRAFGHVLGTREDVQAVWSWTWLREVRQDAIYGLRMLVKDRGFAVVAIVTLALGIGANSAMFAVADATLLRPLPFPDPDRLVLLSEMRRDGSSGGQVNPLDLVDWIERNRSFEAMAAVLAGGTSITGADGTAEPVNTQAVTTRFFDVLGIKPIAGRTFVAADDEASRVVVLSETFWRSRFGGDPTVIGRQIRLGGQLFTAIGVVPSSFQIDTPGFPSSGPISVWTIQGHPRGRGLAERYPHYLPVIGRLKPGVTLEAARSEMASISDALAAETPSTNKGHRATVDPLRERLTSQELRFTSLLLLGVVGFVLLMCCANVANLQLARTRARARELAVRSALGAGRLRIVRQLLIESLVLAVVGGVLGMAVGAVILRVAPSLVPPGLLPTAFPLVFDLRVLTFCLVTTFVVAVLYGLAPAWQATGMSLAHIMSLDTRTSTGARSKLRHGLAIAEVAVAVLLLCGAGLLLRTLLTLEDVDAGVRAGDLLTTRVSQGMDRAPDAMRQFYAAIEREVRAAPGVRDVAWGSALPLEGRFYGQSFEIDGDSPRPQGDRDSTGYQIVSPNYFRLLGVSVLEGRDFTDADSTDAPQVCIVDEAFVRRYLKGRMPIGTRVLVNAMVQPPRPAVLREIVGVVKHIKERPDEPEAQPQLYVPIAQNTWWLASLVVQPAVGPAATLAPAVRAAMDRVDRDRPLQFRTLTGIRTLATARPRFRAVLVGAFAVLALTLAVVGVFGVLAYSVQQRTREFGVRIALGANASSVLRLVIESAGGVIGIGIAIGLMAAAVLSRSISTFLFGVQPLDPMTFVLVPLVLIATAAIAVAAPAWRAVRVNPAVAFRAE